MLDRRWWLSQYPLRRGRRRVARWFNLSHHDIPAQTVISAKPIDLQFSIGPDEVFFDLYFFGTYEYFETELMRAVLLPGDTMFDIGSNFGWFGLHALASVGSSGCVWVFEPQQFLCEEIRRNAVRNGFTDALDHPLVIWNCAVGETNREVSFPIDSSRSHALLSMYQPERETEQRSFSVKQITLDHAVAELPPLVRPPKFIKCDVEGAEWGVMKGARNLLGARHKPILLLEINRSAARNAGWDPETLVSFLEECGYSEFLFVSHAHRPRVVKSRRLSCQARLPDNGNLIALNDSLHEAELARILS